VSITRIDVKSANSWFFLGLLAIVAIYLALAYLLPPGADSLWRLHIAQGLLDGKAIYHDFIEVNPPLWFWGGIPGAALGGYYGVVAINLFANLATLALFYRLLASSLSRAEIYAAVLALAAGLFLGNVAEIGQREQAFLAASALWCGLACARLSGQRVPTRVAVLVAIIAAYGFALKHYFVLVPLAIELALIAGLRHAWRPIRAETSVMALCALVYAGLVVIITPRFLGPILELVQATYFGFGPKFPTEFDRQIHILTQSAALILPFLGWIIRRDNRPIILLLLLTIFTAFIAVMLQQKGWRYHLICAHGLSLVVLALMWARQGLAKTGFWTRRVFPALYFVLYGGAVAVVLYSAFLKPAQESLATGGEPLNPILAQIVAQEPRGHHIAIVSSAPDRAFYVLARAGRPHWTRHYSLWMMPGAITPQIDPKNEATRIRLRDRVIAEFGDDLMCTPPDLIIGEIGYVRTPRRRLLDTMALLQREQAFSDWLNTHYMQVASAGGFPLWRLKGPKPAPSNCLKPQSQ
jgi:hypothetical protein